VGEDGGEVIGEEASGGEGVEERLEDEVEEDGAEGAALPHAAHGQDDERAHDEAIVRDAMAIRRREPSRLRTKMRRRLAQRGERRGGYVTFVDPIDPGGDVVQPSGGGSPGGQRRLELARQEGVGVERGLQDGDAAQERGKGGQVRGRGGEAVAPRKVRLRLEGAAPFAEVKRLGGAGQRKRRERNGGAGGLV
jgi:hypothetical protein